ncbi:MAG: hypothetical protein ACI4RT_01150 [Candidatus Spyradenecus sp.]
MSEAVLRKPGAEEGAGVRTDALSRVELKQAFETYDALFNTDSGRWKLYNEFLEAAKAACGYTGLTADFEEQYLRLSAPEDQIGRYLNCDEGPGRVSDGDFRAFLKRLEGRV